MYLLDTDVVSNFRKKKPHPNLLAWFATVPREEIAISVMTVFEIQSGASVLRLQDPAKASEFEAWLDGIVSNDLSVFPIDTATARLYGRMFVTPALKNFLMPDARSMKPKSGADLIIAATAIIHGATMVTINSADFLRIHERFPLPSLYDPFAGEWLIGGPPAAPGGDE
jgi:predicted nucleic acid-binding protein